MTALPMNNQRGAILIIAMVMLLLLTIIGLSSMRGTSLQESMAGNMRDSSLAFQAAEAALRKGEEVVDGFSDMDALDAAPLTGTYSDFPGVSTSPAYRISLLGKFCTSTQAGVPCEDERTLIRIESEGSGMSLNSGNGAASQVQLRSTFLK
jgi:type IV pilus assembly protein PilX